jgi:hypothetical protein
MTSESTVSSTRLAGLGALLWVALITAGALYAGAATPIWETLAGLVS